MVRKARHLVLLGAGHANLYLATHADVFSQRGCRVTLIDPGNFWYSGLATGMLGGMYEAADDQLDPRPLIEAHGGELIRDRVIGLDASARRLQLAGGGKMAYDYLSLSVGSQVNTQAIVGAAGDPSVWPVKPISNIWKLRQHLQECFRAGGESPRVAVVGGGPSGCELAANLLALAARHHRRLSVTLYARSDRLIKRAPEAAARALQTKLTRRGLAIHTGVRIVARENRMLVTDSGESVPADVVVLALGLEANQLVYESGLPCRPRQGLRVNSKLHSIVDHQVFAAGDCAVMEGYHLPKLGVFGVRQARIIYDNLLASLNGKPLREYKPQKRYLSILNLGDGTALSTWGLLWWNGVLSMRLKHFLDQRFLNDYRQY